MISSEGEQWGRDQIYPDKSKFCGYSLPSDTLTVCYV